MVTWAKDVQIFFKSEEGRKLIQDGWRIGGFDKTLTLEFQKEALAAKSLQDEMLTEEAQSPIEREENLLTLDLDLNANDMYWLGELLK